MDPRSFDLSTLDLENPERRAFTTAAILALLGGVTITITGCGNDSPPTTPTPPPPSGGASGAVSVNHGHTATINAADLSGNSAISIQIRGGATHPHTVDISVQELGQIAAGQRVSKTSSTDPSPDAGTHAHVVTFN